MGGGTGTPRPKPRGITCDNAAMSDGPDDPSASTSTFQPLPRVDGSTLTYETFLRDFALPRQPCIITNLGGDWEAGGGRVTIFSARRWSDLNHKVYAAEGLHVGQGNKNDRRQGAQKGCGCGSVASILFVGLELSAYVHGSSGLALRPGAANIRASTVVALKSRRARQRGDRYEIALHWLAKLGLCDARRHESLVGVALGGARPQGVGVRAWRRPCNPYGRHGQPRVRLQGGR